MVQKHTRFILTTVLCLILIAVFGATALSQTEGSSWIANVWSGMPGMQQNNDSRASNSSQHQDQKVATKYRSYAALGDSVAAGSGLSLIPNATVTDSQCARSSQSFPVLLAKKLQARLTFAACGGATTSHLVNAQKITTVSNPPQLATAFKNGKPDLITITLGANDMRWIQTITDCYTNQCNTPDKTTAIDNDLSDFKMKLYYDLHEIEAQSKGKQPRIILTGYYSLGTQACLATLVPDQVTPAEVTWLSNQTAKLNGTIKSVATEFPNTSYVAIETSQHGLCATGSNRWVQELADPAPFHLTASGEQALANAVYSRIK